MLCVFERLWATNWVKRVSTRGGVIALTFSACTHTSRYLVSAAETKPPLSPASLFLENLFMSHLLIVVIIAARGDVLHIQTLSGDQHTTDCAFPLQIHKQYTLASPRLPPLSITVTQFFLPLWFRLFLSSHFWLIIIIISQVKPSTGTANQTII